MSVKLRKAKLEENIRNRNKNMKEQAKEKSEARRLSRACEKIKEAKTKEDPFAAFMKEFRTRMDKADRKQEVMNEKIHNVSTRIERIESHAKKQDKAYKKEFEIIRVEIHANNSKLEEVVTNNVLKTFQPKIEALEKGVKGDLKSIIHDDVNAILDARDQKNSQEKGACASQSPSYSSEDANPGVSTSKKSENKISHKNK